jgi:hypothetical protein
MGEHRFPWNGDRPAPPPLPELAPPTAQAQLIITFMTDGQIGVQGPVANRVLCYGMLEAAKVAIASQPVSSLVVPK